MTDILWWAWLVVVHLFAAYGAFGAFVAVSVLRGTGDPDDHLDDAYLYRPDDDTHRR